MGKRKGKSKQGPKPSPAPASSAPPPPSFARTQKQGARPPAAPASSAPPPPSSAGTPKQGARPSAAPASSAPPPSLAELSALVEKLTSGDPDSSARRVRLFNRSRPSAAPPPNAVFPNYPSAGSSAATPLPPPGMPKHRFLRRFLPLILTVNLAVGGYVLLSSPKKQLSEKDVDVATEVPSVQVESIEATNA